MPYVSDQPTSKGTLILRAIAMANAPIAAAKANPHNPTDRTDHCSAADGNPDDEMAYTVLRASPPVEGVAPADPRL